MKASPQDRYRTTQEQLSDGYPTGLNWIRNSYERLSKQSIPDDKKRLLKDDEDRKKGYHYILTVIDVLSKYAWTVPLKSKSKRETADLIAEIISKSGRHPKNLQTDMGKEFYNADVQKLLQIHNINHYFMYSIMKASAIKRFNRMLKNYMWKQFTLSSSYNWIDLLWRLVSNYNTWKHLFKIVKVQRANPVTYLLKDYRGTTITGAFYKHELHHATYPDVFLVEKGLRRKGDEVYVMWLGFDKSNNSWIHKNNVI
ncbi:uncharacterized protein LOC105840876 [Monomorium pharaonis]|uniref:uncharacterized protein LOC105840876 n=1 Tax=Monomorium pharaonis TaxID=307658 RepID=UPI00063F2507|nr:uncharacterized protein LOC105840876 [Monomorium pharaonis]